MTAHVVEAAQDAVAAADDDERLVVHLGQEVRAGCGRILLAPDDHPVPAEPPLTLEVEDGRVVVRAPGNSDAARYGFRTDGDLLGGQGRGGRGAPTTAQPKGTVFFGSMNGIAAVFAGQMPPSGATISSAFPGSARPIGTQT